MTSAELNARQIDNARRIVLAAAPYGRDAAKAAVMAARAESSLLVTANEGKTTRADVPQKWRDIAALSMQCPRDTVASGAAWTTADSVGLYQQRPMMGYCTPDLAGVRTLMDLEQSTLLFVRGGSPGGNPYFLKAPGGLSLAAKVQWAQGSEYPSGDNYAPFEPLAEELVARYFPTTDEGWWFSMASVEENKAAAKQAFVEALNETLGRGGRVNGLFITDVIGDLPRAVAKAVWDYKAASLVTDANGKSVNPDGNVQDALLWADRHTNDLTNQVQDIARLLNEVSAKLDALTANAPKP